MRDRPDGEIARHMIEEAGTNKPPMASLITATTVSNTGTGAHFVAIAWFVLITTGSAARTGGVSAAGMLGLAGGSVAGGLLVDWIGPRRVSIGSDIAAAAAVALIPALYATHILAYWHIVLLAFLGGLLDMPGATARQVMVPNISRLSKMTLDMANSWMQFATNGAFMLLGPLVAGLLIPAIGPVNVLFLDATTYLLSSAVVAIAVPNLWLRRSASSPIRSTMEEPAGMRGGGLHACLRFIGNHDQLLALLVAASFLSLLVSGTVTVVVPVISRSVFGDPRALSAMIWGLGFGLTIGFLGLGLVRRRLSSATIIRASFTSMIAMLWLLYFSSTLVVDVGILVVFGVSVGMLIPLAYSATQRLVPAEILGRVLGVSTASVFLAAPLGSVLAGVALAWQSLSVVMATSAATMTVVGLWAMADPRLRGLDRVLDETDQTSLRNTD